MLSNERVEFLRAERNRHIEELNAIDRRISEITQRYQKAVDIELEAINNIDGMFNENGISIIEEQENLDQPIEDEPIEEQPTEEQYYEENDIPEMEGDAENE